MNYSCLAMLLPRRAAGCLSRYLTRPSCKQQQRLHHHLRQALLTLLLLLALSSNHINSSSSRWSPRLLLAVHAQQPMPFIGKGDSPPAVPVDVHVTAYLDRLLNVDDKAYEFQVRLQLLDPITRYRCDAQRLHVGLAFNSRRSLANYCNILQATTLKVRLCVASCEVFAVCLLTCCTYWRLATRGCIAPEVALGTSAVRPHVCVCFDTVFSVIKKELSLSCWTTSPSR
jgi:hypothetical protein